MVHAHSFVINRPTKVTKKFATLIDKIIANCYFNMEIIFNALSWEMFFTTFLLLHT